MRTALEHLSRAGVDASIATHAGAGRIAAVLNTIAVAIMAKAPRPGAVKTRLCPPLRAAEAAELYQCFLLGYLAVVTRKREIRWCNVLLAACVAGSWGVGAAAAQTARFPPADRPVAPIVTAAYSTEAERDAHGEAERVLNRLGVKPGMRVADVGAGDGYYTVRFAKRLGSGGTIYAEDVTHAYLDRLAARLTREGIAGVTIVHGTPDDPRLHAQSIDLVLLAHTYHVVTHQ